MFRLEDELKSLSKSIMDAEDRPAVAALEEMPHKNAFVSIRSSIP